MADKDKPKFNPVTMFQQNFQTAGSQSYAAAIEGKVDAQFGVDYLKYGNEVFNMPRYGAPSWMGTADTAQQLISDAERDWNMRNAAPLSFADRAAGPWEGTGMNAVAAGQITTGGEAFGDLLTPEERAYFESGGTEGAWAAAMGGVATPDAVVGRGRLTPVDVDTSQQYNSTETRVAWLAIHSPGAVQALVASGLKPQDVATVHNVFVAQSAVKRATQLMSGGEYAAAGQLVASLPIHQRIMAAAFLDDEYQKAAAEQANQRAEVEAQAKAAQAEWDQNTPQAAALDPVASRGAPGSARGVSQGDTSADAQVNALGVLLEATLWGVETVTQAARSGYLAADIMLGANPDETLSQAGGPNFDYSAASPMERIAATWNATDKNGFISQATYNESVKRFGKKVTDTMLAFYTVQKEQDPDEIAEFYASIDNDPEATALITSAMRGENVGGDANQGAEAFAFIAAGDQGNFGNVVAGNTLGMDTDSAAFRVTRDTANVASWFVYDPLNLLFGAGKAIRGAKYGLDAAVRMGNGSYSRGMAKMLRADTLGGRVIGRIPGVNRNGVRIAHDDFGRAVESWVKAEGDMVARGKAMDSIRKRFFKNDNAMFTPEDVNLAKQHKLFSADDWARYYDEVADAEDIMRGKPIPLSAPAATEAEAFDAINRAMKFSPDGRAASKAGGVVREGMASSVARLNGQQARRTLYVPHATVARQVVSARVSEYIAGSHNDAGYQRAMRKLENVMGPEWAKLPPAEQEAALFRALSEDADIAGALGYELGRFATMDGTMRRSYMGRAVDRVFDRNEATRRAGARLGLYKKVVDTVEEGGSAVKKVRYVKTKGWAKERGWHSSKDAMKRTLGRLPNVPHGLDTQTANMSEEVFRMVRAAGMGDAAAEIIRSAWISATPAARQNMMIGLTRSFTKAMGISAIDPTAEAKILEQMTGIGWKELYATGHIPRYAGVIADIRREATDAARAAREQIASEGSPVRDGRIAEIDAELAALKSGAAGPAAPDPNATYTIPHPDPAKPAREMKAGYTGENKLNRVPDGSPFPGNWPMDKDPFPVAHMQVPDDLKDAAEGFLGRATAEGAGDVPAVDYQAVRVNKAKQKRIAAAYDRLPESAIDDPEVVKAYDSLIQETEEQAAYMRDVLGIEIVIVDKDPYANPAEMLADVAQNRRIQALSTRASNSSHPYLTDEQNDLFRAVHDFFGHALTGRGFDMHGEEAAWLAHSRMFGNDARRALTTETRGQNSWHHARGASKEFAQQKVALMPDEFVNDALTAKFPRAKGFGTGASADDVKAQAKALREERKTLVAERNKEVKARIAAIKDERFVKRAMKEERKPGGRLDKANKFNPSVDPSGKASALYMGQTSDYMAVPNFRVLDSYAARASYANALLFNNKVGSAVTELWVLGTLAGPRFQLRNGIEDVGLYALTGGSFGSFFRGRKLAQAIDQSMARADAEVLANRSAVLAAEKNLALKQKQFAAGSVDQASVDDALNVLDDAREALSKYESARTFLGRQKYGDHKKLGVVRTAIVNASERITYDQATGRMRDGLVAKMAEFLVPTTSSFERAAAAQKGREAVAELAAQSVLRHKIVWNRTGLAKLVPNRAKSIDDLSPKQLQYMKWEKDLLDSPYGLQFKDEAAESAMHYADGGFVVEKNNGAYVFDKDGNVMQRVPLSKGYMSADLSGNELSEQMARAFMARLRFMTDKYGINQAALHQAPEYFKALLVNDRVLANDIIEDVYRFARSSRDWPYVATRFRLGDDLGAKEHIRRMMDDMNDAFTTRDGRWNQNLWRALRQQDENGKWFFGTDAKVNGEHVINEARLMEGKFDTPSSLLVHRSEDAFLIPAGTKTFSSTNAWEMMGRSLARMTRNPIWYGNYLKARQQLAPMEQAYARVFGEEYAAKVFTDAAGERAYHLTMAWVDNPNVRTQLAWQVRNIARYYRAQEDFARRALRMVKYDPGAIQKANLAWQAQQDIGFVYTDEYGDQYFMYPGSAAVMAVFQNLFGGLNFGGMKLSAAPMAFGGKVQWLSPSLDPGSWLPTVSSPWMAMTLQPLLRTMPAAKEFFKEIERWSFGDVSANMDYTDLNLGDGLMENTVSGAYQMLPPPIKKLAAMFEGATGTTPDGSYGYKMMTKTIMAMAAADQIPRGEEWKDERKREEFHSMLERNVIGVSMMNLIFGFVAPSSPQLMADSVSEAARSAGYSSLNPALQSMIRSTVEKGGTWEEGTIKWMRANPKDSMFLTSASESIGGSYVAATMENVDFLREHQELLDESPLGVTFFVPSEKGAKTDDGAWRLMKAFNLREFKKSEDILMEVANAEGNFETDLAALDIEELRAATPQYDANGETTQQWREIESIERATEAQLSVLYPTRRAGLGEWMAKDEEEFAVEAEQVVKAARALAVEKVPFAEAVLPLVDAYVQIRAEYMDFKGDYQDPSTYTGDNQEYRDLWQGVINMWWERAVTSFPRDRAEKVVKLFTYSMNKGWSKSISLPGEEQR